MLTVSSILRRKTRIIAVTNKSIPSTIPLIKESRRVQAVTTQNGAYSSTKHMKTTITIESSTPSIQANLIQDILARTEQYNLCIYSHSGVPDVEELTRNPKITIGENTQEITYPSNKTKPSQPVITYCRNCGEAVHLTFPLSKDNQCPKCHNWFTL